MIIQKNKKVAISILSIAYSLRFFAYSIITQKPLGFLQAVFVRVPRLIRFYASLKIPPPRVLLIPPFLKGVPQRGGGFLEKGEWIRVNPLLRLVCFPPRSAVTAPISPVARGARSVR